MPDDCNKINRRRSYARIGDVTIWTLVHKKLDLSPAHRKTARQIKTELTAKIDSQIDARNRAQIRHCELCEYISEKLVFEKTRNRNFNLIWTEKFRLIDANGNEIKGTAEYMATGQAKIRVKIYEFFCDEMFGDDSSDFYKVADDIDFTPHIAPSFDLEDHWNIMPKNDKQGLKFKKGKKKK